MVVERKSSNIISQNKLHGVWVPAFAGTTRGRMEGDVTPTQAKCNARSAERPRPRNRTIKIEAMVRRRHRVEYGDAFRSRNRAIHHCRRQIEKSPLAQIEMSLS